jgi:putative addiction module component (TIGR02574 family)
MNETTQQLYTDALRLPEGERAELAASLMASLDPEPDPDALAAWDAEIARRVAELDSGTAKTMSWPEARRRILEDRCAAHPSRPPGATAAFAPSR